ncbi:unnamed protein product [Durusdinium trenchii]|uniref:Uncharacterized protein n=2 Tax=Durusdinium trenchii TaxID=1381693 RepID=A0ABP0SRF6_9DINO
MMQQAKPHGILRCLCTCFLCAVSAQFAEFDYLRNSGPFCPSALELWYLRVPYGAGVAKCGEGTLDGPPLPERPTPPPPTSTTTFTVVTTVPGFQQENQATCCTTLPPRSTAIPAYTTAPPYNYVWDTSTVTNTLTSSSSLTSTSGTDTTISTTSVSSSSTQSMPWWWNSSYVSTTTSMSTSSITHTQTTSTSSSRTTSTSSSITLTSTTAPWPRPTTTTSTFTSSTTNSSTATTTTTGSSSSTSSSSQTYTSSTSSTISQTTTTTISTTSTTLSSTTTVLPDPPVPCLPLCPRITPTACRGVLMSDQMCETTMLNSACFEPSELLFTCPGTNKDPNRNQDLTGGHYGVKCWICSFDSSALKDGFLTDVDLRTGYIQVDLKFGPNMLGSTLNEEHIDGYAIFLTDLEGDRYDFSNPVVSVPKKFGSGLAANGCCEEDAYSARVTTQLPDGVTQVRFEVAPILTGLGPLAVGRISAPVVDAQPFNQVTSFACQTYYSLAFIALLTSRLNHDF